MNRIILFSEEVTNPKKIVITDNLRWGHLRDTLKVQPGARIKVCILGVGLAYATLMDSSRSGGIFSIDESEIQKGSEPWLSLYLGLCRPPTMQKIFEHGTAMGVGDFHLIQGQLSEKNYWKSRIFQKDLYRKYWQLGLSQSAIYFKLPNLHTYQDVRNFHPIKGHYSKFLLDPGASELFSSYPISFDDEISLAIGPERGWSESEKNYFLQAGFLPIRISSAILRVEHAVFHSIAQLELLRLQEVSK